jgi:hypothetical protein
MPDAHDTETLAEVLTEPEWEALNLAAIGYYTRHWKQQPNPKALLETDPSSLAVSMALDVVAPLVPAVEHIVAARIVQARAGEGALRERVEAIRDKWEDVRFYEVAAMQLRNSFLAELDIALTTADPS